MIVVMVALVGLLIAAVLSLVVADRCGDDGCYW